MSKLTVAETQNNQLSECKNDIEKLQSEKIALYELLILGEVQKPEYLSRKAVLDSEIERLGRVFTLAADKLAKAREAAEANAKVREIVSGSGGLTQAAVDVLVQKVWVYPGKRIDIEWKIAGL